MKLSLKPVSLLCLLTALASVSQAALQKGTGSFTLYYVAEVKSADKVKSGGVALTLRDGTVERYRLTPADMRKANMQGTVAGKDPVTGERIVSNIMRVGKWKDLPEGWEGKGNRMNPLTKYRTVAADQKYHRYGSRVFIPGLVGYKTPDGHTVDGYFWVGDTGGGIKGKYRFDVFVGNEPVYFEIMKTDGAKWKEPVEVDNLPSAPSGYSPATDSGLKKILGGLGYDLDLPVEELIAKLNLVHDTRNSLDAALIDFQEQHEQIPQVEYGMARGPVTIWFLTQAAIAVSKGQEYAVKPSYAKAAEPDDTPETEESEPK